MKIPHALTTRPQWVLWRTAKKIPYQLSGIEAKVNDPSTWTTFDAVVDRFERGGYLGIGYMFAMDDPYCGIDLDACRDPATGHVEPWAREIILQFATYAEVSPSRTGVKLFCVGKSPFEKGRKCKIAGNPIGSKHPGIEAYDKLRYFAVTGAKLAGMPDEPVECQASIDELCKVHWPPQKPRQCAPSSAITHRPNDAAERARKYVAKMPLAISGNRGHDATFSVACRLVLGFALTPDEAYPILSEYNQRCEPPWSEKEIWHKLHDADKETEIRGYLLKRHGDNALPLAPPKWCYGHRAYAAAIGGNR